MFWRWPARPAFPPPACCKADAHINGTVGSPAGRSRSQRGQWDPGRRSVRQPQRPRRPEPDRDRCAQLQLVRARRASMPRPTIGMPSTISQRGVLTAHVASNQVQLARFQSLVKDRPGLRGMLNLNADVTAAIAPAAAGTEFQLTTLNASAALHNLEMEGKPWAISPPPLLPPAQPSTTT